MSAPARIFSVNKIIIGLLAAVVVLGMALVVLNNQLNSHHSDRDLATPLSARDMLPEIPDLHGVQARIDESAENGAGQGQQEEPRLMALPKLPDAIDPPATTLRAPISTATLSHEEAPVQPAVQAPVQSADTLAMNKPPVRSTAATAPVAASVSPAAVSAAVQPVEELPAAAAQTGSVQTGSVQSGSVQTGSIQETNTPKAADTLKKPVRDEQPARGEQPARAEQPEQPVQAASTSAPKTERKPAGQTAGQKTEAKAEEKNVQKDLQKDLQKAEQKDKKASAQPRMVVLVREKGATVRVSLHTTIAYKTMLLTSPDRLVVDITGEHRDLRAPGIPANDMVSNVRLGHYPNRTRIVVDLKEAPRKHRLILSEDRERLDIRIDQ